MYAKASISALFVITIILFSIPILTTINFSEIEKDPTVGLIDTYSKIASLAAFLIAIFGAWIALRTFTITAASARKAHMHKLFADYLRFRFDYNLNGGRENNNKHLDDDISSMKLYSLEAIFEWTQNERKLISSPIKFLDIDHTEVVNNNIITCWENTIMAHIKADIDMIQDNLDNYKNCYNPGFLKFIEDALKAKT